MNNVVPINPDASVQTEAVKCNFEQYVKLREWKGQQVAGNGGVTAVSRQPKH